MGARSWTRFWRWFLREPVLATTGTQFVNLAPTANADNAEIYFEALNFATNDDQVLNIALTGPYGSGKSSVIKSFLAKYPRRPALQLSLASFLSNDEAPGTGVTKQEIERSLLQQILYGVEAGKLPFSRFKRIQTPSRSTLVTSLFIALGIAAGWYLFSKQADVLSGSFFKPFDLSNWFNLLCAGIAGAFAWKVVHSVYTTSFGLSLKSISLKDVQIAPDASNTESILNRHLDEILYFFQSTKYDLVVIEDLDRFKNTDIFVTLREINGLINANAGIKRRVRFLYALRDDIFTNTDRTKFFEFIVPIIPVINHSNSIDKILVQGKRVALDARLNMQFVREVSRYLTDLRLIYNIFNEYVIYAANLKADGDGSLDPNKLLAILIYKNVIPADFAALHKQEGALSKVLGRYDEYIATAEATIQVEISTIEAELAIGETQELRDVTELRRVYAMAIVERMPAHYTSLHIGNANVAIAALPGSDQLEKILAQHSVNVTNAFNQRTSLNLEGLELSVDPARTFAQRGADISRKSAAFRQASEEKLRELRRQLGSLRTRRFNEVVRESVDLTDKVFAEVGDGKDLLRYLVLEGYLDDTYYQYISLFHSGRLSPSDHSYLIQIRAYRNPPPDFQIDNCAEVIASMREEDFGHNYVLNRFIFDHMLAEESAHSHHLSAALDFIAANFDACVDFFRSYYASGTHVPRFVELLEGRWRAFPTVALAGQGAATHAARILAYTPDELLQTPPYSDGHFSEFLSRNAVQVLGENVDFDVSRLRTLGVEVMELPGLAGFARILEFLVANGLYKVSIENVRYIFDQSGSRGQDNGFGTRNFSTLRDVKNEALLERIGWDFQTYITEVLLKLEGNVDEEPGAILEVLAHEDVEHDQREEFLRRQTAVFPNLDGIPDEFHQAVMKGLKIEPAWENCIGFMSSEAYDPQVLTEYLQAEKTHAALARRKVSSGEEALALRTFLRENEALPLEVYRSYIQKLPNSPLGLPSVGAARMKVLLEERQVTFTPANFEGLEDLNLRVLFVALNFEEFEADEAQFAIDDEFRARLLGTSLSDDQKVKIIGQMDQSFVTGTASVAADIGQILSRSPTTSHEYASDFLKAIILHSRPIKMQVSLLNRFHPSLSVSEVREVLKGLAAPYREIASFGKSPKIEDSDLNRHLLQWLKERLVISSFGKTLIGDEIKVNTFRKPN